MIELTKAEALQLLDEMDGAIIQQLETLEEMAPSLNTKAAIAVYKRRRAALAYAVAALTGKTEETAPPAPSAEPESFGAHIARRFLKTE